jgi:FkbM family methyltransferase
MQWNRIRLFQSPVGRIYVDITESHTMMMRVYGSYEPHKTALLRFLLRPGSGFIDVGAHIGYFTLMAAGLVGDSGVVFAFEPEKSNFYWLRKNVQVNHIYQRVSMFALALSCVNTRGRLFLGTKSGWHTLLPGCPFRQSGSLAVEVRTLDSLLALFVGRKITAIKIDVEGAELEVLKGARRFFVEHPDVVILVDLHPALGVNSAQVVRYLTHCNFRVYDGHSLDPVTCHMQTDVQEIVACRDALLLKRYQSHAERLPIIA